MNDVDRPAGSRSALIVGAGIGGLAAALALARTGWQVRIFERASSPNEQGFALVLAPNAIAALQELGLAATVIARGVAPARVEVRRPDGRVLRRLALMDGVASTSPRAVVILRRVLHSALLDAVGQDRVELNSEAVGFEESHDRVELRIADGRLARGDLLIGADGIGSMIRKLMHPEEAPPFRSGFLAVRGVAHDAAHHLGALDALSYMGGGIEAGVARVTATSVYWYVSLLAEDIGTRCARTVMDRCTQGFDAQFQTITGATALDDLRLDELFDRTPLERWGHGRATLLGDAAHPMLPHAGQGAAQALEDAVGVGLALARPDSAEAALRRYEQVRSHRTRRIVLLARRIARVTTTRNSMIAGLRDLAVRVMPRKLLVNAFVEPGQKDPNRDLRQSRR